MRSELYGANLTIRSVCPSIYTSDTPPSCPFARPPVFAEFLRDSKPYIIRFPSGSSILFLTELFLYLYKKLSAGFNIIITPPMITLTIIIHAVS